MFFKDIKKEHAQGNPYKTNIQLHKGNCLELMKDIPDESIDMICCDLPYGITANKWDTILDWDLLWEQYNRIITNNGNIVLFAAPPFDKKLAMSNIQIYRYEWVWIKNMKCGFLNAKKQPLRRTERILIFFKTQGVYNFQGTKQCKIEREIKNKHSTNYGIHSNKPYMQTITNYPLDTLYFNLSTKRYHPTQKPLDLLKYLILTYTNKENTVLDNCMGAGSTGIAATLLGRHFIGMELSSKFFKKAKERIQKAEKSLFVKPHTILK